MILARKTHFFIMERQFPHQYSEPLRKIIKAISIHPNVVGSTANPELLYAGDVDMVEALRPTPKNIRKFQRVVKRVARHITDIKCGEKDGEALRWTPQEVAYGEKKGIPLLQAVKTGLTKIDVVVWDGQKYVEVSNIFAFRKLKNTKKQDIRELKQEGNYFKALKKAYTIHRDTNIRDILNSPLGNLALIITDMRLLQEFPDKVRKRKRQELDTMRNRFAKLLIPGYEHATPSFHILPQLEAVLQRETRKAIRTEGIHI